jgi:DNA-binding NarL/FixJ family response regulator
VALRVLIIDDHRDYRVWLGHHLAAAFPEAAIVGHNPLEDNLLPTDFEPAEWDLVFLDHRLGEHDGIEMLEDLKGRADCPPVIFLSPQGDKAVIEQALRGGADDYLPKGPVDHQRIVRVASEALNRRGAISASGTQGAPRKDLGEFKLKGHRFLRALGTGSTASVYLMEKFSTERLVVVKVFRQVPDEVDRFGPLQRFLQEYEVVSAIRHPNVVHIHELGIADDLAYIAMEYFAGGKLGERIGSGLPLGQALEVMAQITHALAAIHKVGVLHRDLKPANIMFRDDGSLALIDFGVAKLRDATIELSGLGEIYGTPYYMSPEQGEGLEVDERSDIYSLGVVFHEMLTGRRPYVAGSPLAVIRKHAHAPLPQLPESLAECQPLLERMMAKSPSDRLPTAEDVMAEVEALTSVHLAETLGEL